jgi:hypothetical protein
MPLTPQEQAVKDLLVERNLPFEAHHVFELSQKVRISVDFLVFVGPGIVLECTLSERRRGSAMSEVRRRCAFINYRFGLLKASFPKILCGALIEAPNESQEVLKRELSQLLANSDFWSESTYALRSPLARIVGGRYST